MSDNLINNVIHRNIFALFLTILLDISGQFVRFTLGAIKYNPIQLSYISKFNFKYLNREIIFEINDLNDKLHNKL